MTSHASFTAPVDVRDQGWTNKTGSLSRRDIPAGAHAGYGTWGRNRPLVEQAFDGVVLLSPDETTTAQTPANAPLSPHAGVLTSLAAVSNGSRTRARTQARSQAADVTVRVLGTFAIEFAGMPVAVTSSRVTQLIKTLAIRGGRAPVDVVLDRLWPDSSVDVGRRRLKNVLTRTRRLLGDLVVRCSDALAFRPSVTIDLVEFSTACTTAMRALAEGSEHAVDEGLAALDMYGGALLPDDCYDDYVAPIRLTEIGRAMLLVDGILAQRPSAEIGPAILNAILVIDANDAVRLERFARWAATAGETGLVRSATAQLRWVTAELGIPMPAEIQTLPGAST